MTEYKYPELLCQNAFLVANGDMYEREDSIINRNIYTDTFALLKFIAFRLIIF